MLGFSVTLLLLCVKFCTSEHAQKELTHNTDVCQQVSPRCVTEADRYSLEALQHIHREMDDDQDGGIEVEESVEFIIEDMQQQQQTNKHSMLHREDQHITVEELWRGWKSSEVHNWTQDEVLRWLREFVELPQYEKNFKELHVNGNTLPRIASNEPSFMSTYLKIQDQQHKHKLKLKALDVVLFGPPTRPPHNWMKDLLLIVSIIMGLGGCWFAQVQNKASKEHISKMMKDLESLQRAEQSLRDLQEQLERAQEEKRTVAVEKQFLEEKMRDEIQGAQEEANRLQELRQGAVSELSRLRYAEEELEQIRGALKRAEQDMQVSWSVPESLQLWLQFTHEVEMQYYNVKKQNAEQQLATAKDEAEKIKKKRSSVLGTLHVAHSSSLDQVDHKILQAKNALAEVTSCLQERLHRWQQIELLCGFPIMHNAGLASLTATLYPDPNWMLLPRASMSSYQIPAGVDDMEDGRPSIMPQIPVTVTPIKLSPRSLVRSRRSAHIVQTPVILSPDPDLLVPIRPSISRYAEDDGDGIIFSPRVKQECLEADVDPEQTGPTAAMKYVAGGLDTPPRKLYRDNLDYFSDGVGSRTPTDLQEDRPLRKISREELGSSLRGSLKKASQEEHNVETQARKISREEARVSGEALASLVGTKEPEGFGDSKKSSRGLSVDLGYSSLRLATRDASLEPYLGLKYKDEAEMSAGSQRRKMFRDRKDLSGESLSRMMPIEEYETGNVKTGSNADMEVDAGSIMPRGEAEVAVDTQLDSASAQLLKDDIDISMEAPRSKLARDNQVFPPTPLYRDGLKIFRGVSTGSSTRKKARNELDDRKDDTMSKMLPRDEREVVAERQRLFQDYRLDSSLDSTDTPVETLRHKICRDEVVVPDSAPFGQPDLTISSLVLWTPTPDPLSHLVYDGILEKSHQSPRSVASPEDLDRPASLASAFTSTQSLVDSEGSGSTSAPEPGNKEKGKKSSKLKNLFKKKKDKEKDKDSPRDHPQGGLQKLCSS